MCSRVHVGSRLGMRLASAPRGVLRMRAGDMGCQRVGLLAALG